MPITSMAAAGTDDAERAVNSELLLFAPQGFLHRIAPLEFAPRALTTPQALLAFTTRQQFLL